VTRIRNPARVFEARRQETVSELKQRLRQAREQSTADVRDAADNSELDCREDIEVNLIRMKADTLQQIDEALWRIERDTYGCCTDCGHQISEERLRAMPVAARCKECQEVHERAEQLVRRCRR